MSCRTIRDWLHRDAASLEPTHRLVLDDHLATCASCREARRHLLALQQVSSELPVPAAESREYQRAIARALIEGRREPLAAPRRWIAPLALASAVAAGTIAYVVISSDDAKPARRDHVVHGAPVGEGSVTPPPNQPPPAPARARDIIEAGTLQHGDQVLRVGDAIPSDVVLRSAAPARVRLAAVRVIIAASSEIRWEAPERMLLLDRGSVELDSAEQATTRVSTSSFVVELGDAAAAVEPRGVRVVRGTVRLVDHAGKLLARIGAGASWTDGESAKPKRPPSTSHVKSVADVLAEARAAFAAKHYPYAERIATELVARTLSRTEQADVRTFLAEVAHASGKLDIAIARYEAVADDLADLAAGESALYAAARLELRRGRRDAARTLFARYLDRYPGGRYAEDARRQHASLP